MPMVQQISKCMIKPAPPPEHQTVTKQRIHLTPWDLAMLSAHYIQKGLLFSTPLPPIQQIIQQLKSSLSAALLHFHPLAGRLVTDRTPNGLYVSIECNRKGAEFIYAVAGDITVSEILSPSGGTDVPSFIESFFPHNGAVNHDGHYLPLLAIQLTELADGIFVACCFNHVAGDGTAYWHFFNSLAEIARTDDIARLPDHDRWFIDGEAIPIKLPFSDTTEFIERDAPPPLRERIFHFTSLSMAKLKAKAIEESGTHAISSFQALCALLWRSITRARRLPREQRTSCRLAIQNRARLKPSLSPYYFGNSIYVISATVTAGELLAGELGWAAGLVNEAIGDHTDGAIRGKVRKYHVEPVVYKLSGFDKYSVMMGSSPRFDMYGCDFGWGEAVGLRSGPANKFDGKVSSYPGREGGGSVDLEICLMPEYMAAMELDQEFMDAVSTN